MFSKWKKEPGQNGESFSFMTVTSYRRRFLSIDKSMNYKLDWNAHLNTVALFITCSYNFLERYKYLWLVCDMCNRNQFI